MTSSLNANQYEDLNIEIGQEEHLVTMAEEEEEIGEQPVVLPPSSEDNLDNDDNDNDTDNASEAEFNAAATSPSSGSSLCHSRKNKLFALLATVAVLAIIALSAGFGVVKSRSNGASTNVSAAAALDEVDYSEVTDADTAAPSYSPTVASVSNDEAVDGEERGVRGLRVR
mmetsp:Transcript_5594/g.12728  ORF Transcript_5594/g.12728 Transcript_5594/m.12728 type:complete len:170 (+) Transcript_5594:68-577(+)|eukprot:CAMPEP_0172310800 /NCGR_PEP_ID=MMETSP1058-20130122/12691_1 /TAXON_ID=83371 /ORGANISM="Detonula confervacea, Strain CCMP 353" /LENGTH=169 /DNA_ID=CAMNT_0013023739 /DNA_START=52 /DNA_END=561 /DNA_ORIENTATION=+